MPLTTMGRSSLVDRVIEQLRALIESGEWPIESKIPAESVLVRDLGVGRNTVREAVRALVHTGMLEPLPGDGTYVRADDELGAAVLRRLRRAGHLEALEVRASLERDAARLAAARSTPADIAALRAALARQEAARRAGDDVELVSADLEFHSLAVGAAHNSMLSDLYAHLTEGLRATLQTVVHAPLTERQRYQREAHSALVDAVEAGDADAAQRHVEDYIAETVDAVHTLDAADRDAESPAETGGTR
jgi:DNA-binding FadR family transcriptional regulator